MSTPSAPFTGQGFNISLDYSHSLIFKTVCHVTQPILLSYHLLYIYWQSIYKWAHKSIHNINNWAARPTKAEEYTQSSSLPLFSLQKIHANLEHSFQRTTSPTLFQKECKLDVTRWLLLSIKGECDQPFLLLCTNSTCSASSISSFWADTTLISFPTQLSKQKKSNFRQVTRIPNNARKKSPYSSIR